jgi:cell division protease FtsH
MSESEKQLTAWHEAGHAIVALNVPESDPVHKATIIPRGRALGMVMQLPEGDRYSMNFTQMTSRLAVMMGGRVAEELHFGKDKVTSGASSDISAATSLAKMMVTRWGFSDVLGLVAYGDNQDEVFLGMQVSRQQNISGDTAKKIDAEIRRLVEAGYNEAKRILTEKADEHKRLAEALLDYETLNGEEIAKVLKGEKLDRPEDTPSAPSAPTPALPVTDEDEAGSPHPGGWGGAQPQGA